MRPTPEQQRAIDLFLTGEGLRINAFAGSGKTSTLRFIAAATERRGIYLAFNSAIAREARAKFPPHVLPYTIHGFAWRQMQGRFGGDVRKLAGETNGYRIAELLRPGPIRPARECYLTPAMVASVVRATVQRFCQGDERRIGRRHVPRRGITRRLSWWTFRQYAGVIVEHARRLWGIMADPATDVPLGHDGYLKLWALSDPVLPADFVLLDEAQDSSGLVVGLLRRQPAQVVTVGDRHQQIYAWRGAVNAMERMRTKHRADLTQSFRFGPEIAAAATRVLRVLGERKAIRGNPAIRSRLRCDDPEAVLCRTNAEVLARAAESIAGGRSTGILGGGRELAGLLDDVERLQQDRRAQRPVFFGYRRWTEVLRAVESGEAGELRGLVRLVRRHGVAALRGCLGAVTPEAHRPELVIATAHKAKGCEWSRVVIADDFSLFRRLPFGREVAKREDVRLFYVALTRAREAVGMPPRIRGRFGIDNKRY